MSVKRLILLGLTVLVSLLMGVTLVSSLAKPQVQGQLELYQTNLLLQASLWNGDGDPQLANRARTALIPEQLYQDALEKYQQAEKALQADLNRLEQKQTNPAANSTNPDNFSSTSEASRERAELERRAQAQLGRLKLRTGLLLTQNSQVEQALSHWQGLSSQPGVNSDILATAQVLQGLWSQPPQLLPDAEATLNAQFSGWFRAQSLAQLYQLQQRQESLAELNQKTQQSAESALVRLVLVGGLPVLGCIIGGGLLTIWLISGWRRRTKAVVRGTPSDTSPAAGTPIGSVTSLSRAQLGLGISVPWGPETIWQVMVFWFLAYFALSLVGAPLIAGLSGLNPQGDALSQTLFALLSYGLLMVVGFSILYFSLKSFLPRPWQWFPFKFWSTWWLWGIAGYLVALPMVILASLLNQSLLQEQGGENPILEIILNADSNLAVLVLFLMVAVLAPLLEETLFRGFFLTSLTRYLPTWGAIALSGGVFALAHLNVADLLPLTVLGMVLGYIYLRSGNLLAAMLLHGIWNSGTLLGLLFLAGGAQ